MLWRQRERSEGAVAIPSNTTAGTAINVVIGRETNTEYTYAVDVRDSGTNYDTWWKLTTTYTGMVGCWFLGDDSYVYAPSATVYTDLGVTEYYGGAFTQSWAFPWQMPVVAGVSLWIKVNSNTGGAAAVDGTSTLNVSIITAPHRTTYPRGSIVIMDDSGYDPPFPSVVLSPIDGEVLGFISGIDSGDSGDVLPSGDMLLESFLTSGSTIYDRYSVPRFDVALEPIGIKGIQANAGGNAWYIRSSGDDQSVRRIDRDGTIGPEIGPTGSSTVNFSVSNDETVVYHATASAGSAIKRWDIGSGTDAGDLVAGITNYTVQDMTVMADDSIVVAYYYHSGSPNRTLFKQYTASGDEMMSVSEDVTGSGFLLSAEGSRHVNVWRQTASFESRFIRIRLSDGAIVNDVTRETFTDGTNTHTAGAPATTPTRSRFGNETSCPHIVLAADYIEPITAPASLCCCGCECGGGSDKPLPSARGAVLEPVSEEWERECSGGGVVPSASDPTDSESWL